MSRHYVSRRKSHKVYKYGINKIHGKNFLRAGRGGTRF